VREELPEIGATSGLREDIRPTSCFTSFYPWAGVSGVDSWLMLIVVPKKGSTIIVLAAAGQRL